MSSICFYFQVHQPLRIKKYRYFDIGTKSAYFDDDSESNLNNKRIIHKVAGKSYLPTNKLLLELIKLHPEFKVSFSLSGLAIEQFERFSPETLESFQRLVDTGRVEVLSETYYHSLSFLHSKDEFKSQIELHAKKLKAVFGVNKPEVFRNTELIYNNDLAVEVEKMGYKGILAEGADHILGWRSPNFVYSPVGVKKIKILLKNYKLSDDIAFRFSEKTWKEYPLTSEKFASWANAINGNGEVINLFMDYETFGEHQWEDTGIFNFLRALPGELLKHPDNDFVTPSEAVKRYKPVGAIDAPNYVSWADVERDLSAWLSNSMQEDAMKKLYALEDRVQKSKNRKIKEDWRRLTTSDHFYYMCVKWFNDGDVHAYFNPYDSPYDAFRYYMNVLADMEIRLTKNG
ncbi:alpha-amylase [Candidatus Woesebacteria bacterium RIFCSPHIGHO2_01_FULL_44_21]|uniref:Alpha-amylase n=1 Tax=Candidatus Woesebacteria bacterium RIFCSPHIGHO2_01_FULL_44_21 TaxID=1802503 RepID=A0A1F7YYY0_9BACT|nr:MAG: alpha-amylase [Candidatus Woesebacteria bacterium RIFCSPHIGHO2_01_FULL_44_21]OGM69133.1 MAG: alpha-amylase [Candidatus Woesebacteria bacterium RIFCSPLOWO2_01_FULL_44_24b]